MAQSRFRAYRVWMAAALLVAGMLAGVGGSNPAGADVTAVKGSAYGFLATNISIFNGAQSPTGPTPEVTLPQAGSGTPVTGTVPTGLVRYGPATLFSSGQVDISTRGTTGPGGSVNSSATVANLNTSGQEVLTATTVASTCTASESGVSGTTTVTGGTLRTSEGNPDVDGDDTVVTVPTNPAPNTKISGQIESVGDTFEYIFNEQITNPDGSITVYAAHQRLLGPTATGDLFIGKSECGVTATASTTTTAAPGGATTTTGAPGATTTTPAQTPTTATPTPTTAGPSPTTSQPPVPVPQNPVTAQQTNTTSASTNTTAASTNTTAAPSSTEVGGGAYGFFVSVGLFGGAPATRGPAPTVTLPSAGSATPITESAPTGNAQFGPAIIFTSDKLEVSTQGTPGATVTSSATVNNVNRSGQEQITAATIASKCTSSGTEHTGSTTITGGSLRTSEGNPDVDGDDTVVQLPGDPAPNTPYEGKVEAVGDSFRVVLNEQVKTAGGITVNAVHMYLLGPTAVGELIIGQSRCGTTGGGAGGSGGGGGAGGGGGGAGGGGLAGTGNQAAVFVALALVLLMGGWTATFWTVGAGGRARRVIPASLPARPSGPPRRTLR